MRIKGTFLDEISHDIPHQNWGEAEWDRDFGYMREAGIDTVILIRCGYRRWQTFPSRVLTAEEGCYEPPVDLVDMFLRLSDKWGMNFWFGLYDSGKYWDRGEYEQEVALNKRVIDEAWSRYGHCKSFAGWYISQECSRNTGKIVDLYASLGRYCKEVSGGLPTMISPYIDGSKNVSQYNASTSKENVVTLESHEREWDAIFAGIQGAVDIVAFQDGHVEYDELVDQQETGRPLRTGVLDQFRDLRPRYADQVPADQMGEAAAQDGAGGSGRLPERHYVRVLALYESAVGLPAGGALVRPLYGVSENLGVETR